jgi:phosphatidate cytidylyltransferase
MHNVYNGLFWFALPIFLVICNDSFAWFSGVTCGRKFIHREFLRLSPNKTWEGFIGGCIGTMFVSWYLSKFMAQFKWMKCPMNEFLLFPKTIDCEVDPIFQEANIRVPSQIFELFPAAFFLKKYRKSSFNLVSNLVSNLKSKSIPNFAAIFCC